MWRNGLELHLKVHLFKLPTKLIAVAVPTQPWRGIWPFILRSQQREICRVPVTIKWLTYCNCRTTKGIFHTRRVFVQCSFLTENIFTNVARLKILKKDVYKFYVLQVWDCYTQRWLPSCLISPLCVMGRNLCNQGVGNGGQCIAEIWHDCFYRFH